MDLGVVALQGAVSEHMEALRRSLSSLGLEGEVVPVRRPGELEGLSGVVLPGGESTTISRLLASSGLGQALQEKVPEGLGVLATCAGAILMADQVVEGDVEPLGLMGCAVERNAFGRQRESFEALLEIEGLESPFSGIFIRAPAFARCGAECQPLATLEGHVVAARQERRWALSFHPELGGDDRLHRAFLSSLTG